MMLTQTWDVTNLAHVDQAASTRSATEQLASYSGGTYLAEVILAMPTSSWLLAIFHPNPQVVGLVQKIDSVFQTPN